MRGLWAATLMLLAACAPTPAAETAMPSGVLTGTVQKTPFAPVQRLGAPPPQALPVAGVDIVVLDARMHEVARRTSDDVGAFRFELAAGTYHVQAGPLPGRLFTKDLPATVEIRAAQPVVLDVHLDTGMR